MSVILDSISELFLYRTPRHALVPDLWTPMRIILDIASAECYPLSYEPRAALGVRLDLDQRSHLRGPPKSAREVNA